MAGRSIGLDLRVVFPVVALGAVVLVIIFVELCGRESVQPLVSSTPLPALPTATTGPTFTPGPSPTLDPALATATQETLAGGETRDTARLQDLSSISDALERYRDENGSYPDTAGNIQTLCTFRGADTGCAVEEFLSPLPQDPLGDSGQNGYWYAGTNVEFILYAQRESEAFEACDEQPEHLAQFASLLCVQGP